VITDLGGEIESEGVSHHTSVNSTTSSLFTGERVNRLVKNLRLPFGSGSNSNSVTSSSMRSTPSSPATAPTSATQYSLHEKLIEESKSSQMTPRASMGFNSSFNNDTTTPRAESNKNTAHSFDVENANPLHNS
jgi:hypothetical protein